jgi:hypothetical protein
MTVLGRMVDSKHVRIRIKKKQIPKFLASLPKGFDVTVYPVIKQNKRQYYDEDIRNMTFNVTRRNPDPTCRKSMEDIDNFLATIHNIDPRIKLLSDKITTKDQPNLMTEPYIKIETLLDAPGVKDDPELDKYVSKAEDVRDVKIRESQIAKLHKQYDEMKKEYVRTKFSKDDVTDTGERDDETNERIYTVRQGEI